MTTSALRGPAYPVEVTGHLDRHLSRWLWLVKWVLVIPHLLVLVALWAGFVVLTLVALVAIVVTGRYPRVVFDYNVGVLRWTWRVGYYAYGALGTDEYPPFTLAERPDYPATLHVDYPEHLSRGLALVKWWLLALPHYLVIALFVGGAWAAESDAGSRTGPGLIGVLVVIAAVVLLVTGTYPRAIFDFVLGMNRWVLRVAAYAGLMTDRYPPFRLDQGGDEPGAVLLDQPVPPAPPSTAAAPPAPAEGPAGIPPATVERSAGPGWTGLRTAGVTLGALACLFGLVLGAGGGALLVVDQVGRDDAGFVTAGTEHYRTDTGVLLADVELLDAGPGWLSAAEQLGTVSLTVRPTTSTPVFVGIGPTDDVMSWLDGSAYDRVSQFGGDTAYRRTSGSSMAPDPTSAGFWVGQPRGTVTQHLRWHARDGHWTVVVMNADGTPGLSVEAKAGATLPHLGALAGGLLGAGAFVLLLGTLIIVLAIPRRPQNPAAPTAAHPPAPTTT